MARKKVARSTSEALSIGKLAKRANVGVDTIRFYEREGLIEEPERHQSSGYRQYKPDAARRIQFIRRAQELGFTLREVKDLLSLRVRSGAKCNAVKAKADAKLAEIGGKIRDLQRMRESLSKLSAACSSKQTTSECPILDCFEGEGECEW